MDLKTGFCIGPWSPRLSSQEQAMVISLEEPLCETGQRTVGSGGPSYRSRELVAIGDGSGMHKLPIALNPGWHASNPQINRAYQRRHALLFCEGLR